MENDNMTRLYNAIAKIQDNIFDMMKEMYNLDKKISTIDENFCQKLEDAKVELKEAISNITERKSSNTFMDSLLSKSEKYLELENRITNLESFAMQHGYTNKVV